MLSEADQAVTSRHKLSDMSDVILGAMLCTIQCTVESVESTFCDLCAIIVWAQHGADLEMETVTEQSRDIYECKNDVI